MNNKYEDYFKYLSLFLLGSIVGFFISKVNLDFINSSGKTLGEENTPITITEYSDFQCPLCKQFFDNSFNKIREDYIKTGKVKYVFKHFPLKSIHPQATNAALAAECASEQGKFWEMHDELFATQNQWSGQPNHLDQFRTMATNLKLDSNQFNDCLTSQKYLQNVDQDYNEGIIKKVDGTPTFFINNQLIIGAQPTSVFIDTIDKLLK